MTPPVVGITAARRAPEQAALVRALGAVPMIGPCVDLDRPRPDGDVLGELAEALSHRLDAVVVMTGIGARHLVGVAERTGRDAELRAAFHEAYVLARGAKARRALRGLDIRVDAIADPPESAGVIAALAQRGVTDANVLVQCALPDPDPIVAAVADLDATVFAVHPYDIAAPADLTPARVLAHAALDGELDALTFTSANAVHGFAAIVEQLGLDASAIPPSCLLAAVGPVTRTALAEHGLRVDLEPRTPRMGALYQALAARLSGQPDAVHPLD